VAITFVGSHIGTHAATSAQAIALSNLKDAAGSTPTLQQNDLVIVTVFQAATATRTQAQLLPTGYTASHAAVITSTDTNVSSQQTSHKVMGATPDTTVSIPAAASTTVGIAYSIHVLRGVDQTTPIDVAAVTASGINGAQPNPGAITPTTAGAWIYIAAGGAMAAGAAPQSAPPTGLSATTNHYRQTVLTTTTNDPGLAAGLKTDWSSGAFDCAALTGYTTTNTGSWTAVTLAFRPMQWALVVHNAYSGGYVGTGLSSEMLSNGSFADSSAWTLGGGVTLSGGNLTCANAAQIAGQPITFVNGAWYHLTFDYAMTAGEYLRVNIGDASAGLPVNNTNVAAISPLLQVGSSGTQTLGFQATLTSGGITLEAHSALYFGTIDNVSLKCVSNPTLSPKTALTVSSAVSTSLAGVLPAGFVWDVSTGAAQWTLSNSNLTAATTGGGTIDPLSGTLAGKGQFDLKIDTLQPFVLRIGIASASDVRPDTTANGVCLHTETSGFTSILYNSNNVVNASQNVVQGDTVRLVWDGVIFTVYRQAASTGSFTQIATWDSTGSGLSSMMYPAVMCSTGSPSGQITLVDTSQWVGAAAVLDAANSSTDWTYSNSNFTAARNVTTAGFWAMLRASVAKTTGSFTVKVDAIGTGLLTAIGVDVGTEPSYPGGAASFVSIGYVNTGNIEFGGSNIAAASAFTTGDVIKVDKAANIISFYRQAGGVGSFVLQATINTSDPIYSGGPTPVGGAVYPAASNGNGTGTQLTADFSGWASTTIKLGYSASSGTTLAPSAAASASQAGSVTLVPKTALVIQAAASLTTAANVVLIPRWAVVVQAAASLSVVDGFTMAAKAALVPSAAASLTTTSSPLLAPKTTLTLAAATSLSVADAVVLSPKTQLSLVAATSLSVAGNVTLVVAGGLGIQPATSLTTTTTPSLVPKWALALQASTSLSTAAAVALAAKTSLALQAASSLSTVSAVTSTFHPVLAPQAASSLSTLDAVALASRYSAAVQAAVSASVASAVTTISHDHLTAQDLMSAGLVDDVFISRIVVDTPVDRQVDLTSGARDVDVVSTGIRDASLPSAGAREAVLTGNPADRTVSLVGREDAPV
jgi:hypothetical protein